MQAYSSLSQVENYTTLCRLSIRSNVLAITVTTAFFGLPGWTLEITVILPIKVQSNCVEWVNSQLEVNVSRPVAHKNEQGVKPYLTTEVCVCVCIMGGKVIYRIRNFCFLQIACICLMARV